MPLKIHQAILVGALVAGCTFPDVTIDAGGGGSAGAGSTGSAPSTSATMSVSVSVSGSTSSMMMGCVGNWGDECDDDGDMVARYDIACCPVMAEADCNDQNIDVFPGQTMFFEDPISGTNFDYDCSNANEREFDFGFCNATFAMACDEDPQPLAYIDGPMDATACGQMVTRVFCTNTTTCGEGQMDMHKLKCR